MARPCAGIGREAGEVSPYASISTAPQYAATPSGPPQTPPRRGGAYKSPKVSPHGGDLEGAKVSPHGGDLEGAITKEDIFYYVYGILHSPKYRETFANDLKKSLPRIPLVEKAEDFRAFSRAGRELGAWHVNYETGPINTAVKVYINGIQVPRPNGEGDLGGGAQGQNYIVKIAWGASCGF